MSVFDRLTGLDLPADTTVTMSYSEGTDVFVHNETAVDDAIGYTDVIQTFYTQEMLKKGFLSSNTIYSCISHSKFNTLFCQCGFADITFIINIIHIFSDEMISMDVCHWFFTV